MPFVHVNGIQLYYEQNGSGPDLVFISGLASDHSLWDSKYFTDRFRVLTFDNRGMGKTDVPEGPYSIELFASDTIALCQTLGISRAHFVGHSMGGHIVQHIGADYSSFAEKLVIACSEQEFSIVSYIATHLQMEFRKYHLPRELIVESYLPVLLSLSFLEDKKKLDQFLNFIMQLPSISDEGYREQVKALQKHNTKHLLHKIHAPTLIIGCEHDLLTPLKNSEYLRDHIDHAELQVIKNSGHVPFVEQPEEFYQMIANFL